jgi:hypothetical protein
LEPVAQRSRYTLLLVPTGKKMKNFQLSVPLAVVPALKLHEHISTQVFYTPIDAITRRETSPVFKVFPCACSSWISWGFFSQILIETTKFVESRPVGPKR